MSREESNETVRHSGARIPVMQVVDSLAMGGAESVAVNLANALPKDRFASYLCATRSGGPLENRIAPHVTFIRLDRRGRFDISAVRRMMHFVESNGIRIVHAHGSSLFIARIAALGRRSTAIIWHDHFGRCELDSRSSRLYRMAVHGAGVIAVNNALANWSREKLHVPDDRVWYVPNWVDAPAPSASSAPSLPGHPGQRVVCVANFRAQKDHLTLLRAILQVRETHPDVQLLLVGGVSEPECAESVKAHIHSSGLSRNVTILGPRQDVNEILKQCDIGVLSSASEGLPLVLLEYGMAGLPVVATDVGQCREVLDDGRAGILVPPASPGELAGALVSLLKSREQRAKFGTAFQKHVRSKHDPQTIISQICQIYDRMLAGPAIS